MAEKESPWLHLPPGETTAPLAGQAAAAASAAPLGCCYWSVALAPLLGSSSCPKLDEGNIWLTIGLPQSSGLTNTGDVGAQGAHHPARLPRGEGRDHPWAVPDGTDPRAPTTSAKSWVDLQTLQRMALPPPGRAGGQHVGQAGGHPGLPTNFSR